MFDKFMRSLKENKENLTRQEYRTLKGQALSGDSKGAMKGLLKLMERKVKYDYNRTF